MISFYKIRLSSRILGRGSSISFQRLINTGTTSAPQEFHPRQLWPKGQVALWVSTVAVCATSLYAHSETAFLDNKIPSSGDVISAGTPISEPATGILFPQLCNGLQFTGCGVRIKFGLLKIYAVATYLDPLAMDAVKKSTPDVIEQALMNPTYPRTIRIVMNRNLNAQTFTAAVVEALQPRMNGQDLDKLEEFKQMNPTIDLVKGAEVEMTIRGDMFLYKNSLGGVGSIRSEVFTRAMCDVYYGADPVSPTHKKAVLEGVKKL